MSKSGRYRLLIISVISVLLLGAVMWMIGSTRQWMVQGAKSAIVFYETLGEEDRSPPAIDLWYGHRMVVGQRGASQRWLNIPGRVMDAKGKIASLTYSLNNPDVEYALSVGPDKRRLAQPGDFNIDILRADLQPGSNTVVISARDDAGNVSRSIVEIERRGADSTTIELPLEIDWSKATSIQDLADVVDGRWMLVEGGVRTHPDHVGYDRVIAIGDTSWTDYQVTVPITLHNIDERGHLNAYSARPGLGINLRWTGHTDQPVVCSQPHCGWEPMGAFLYFDWKLSYQGESELAIEANPRGNERRGNAIPGLIPGKTYWFKAAVITVQNRTLYRLKVWDADNTEPDGWMLEEITGPGNMDHGSFLINAHHVDATFGNILVEYYAEEI